MKYEQRHQNLISWFILGDVMGSMNAMKRLCMRSEDSKFDGYVQEVSLEPFGFLLVTYLQVRSIGCVLIDRKWPY